MMKGPNNNDEGKEKSPIIFPMLHIKDATKKGGPKAPPRNKVTLYEKLITPSQSTLHSASRSPSFLPSSRHVSDQDVNKPQYTVFPVYCPFPF